mgnify:CR=1 FL=1
MIIEILLILAGLALVVFGSDYLVDGASAIARKSGVSEFVIGVTIVGFGTSCPELVVSLTGAIQGSADISIGNVVGSNIMNTLLILGLTAVLAPIAVTKVNLRRDIPVLVGVTLFFVLLTLKGTLNWIDGVLFLLLFAGYMAICLKSGKEEVQDEPQEREIGMGLAILMVVGGLAALVFGGRLFVNHAVNFAKAVGVSEKFIAVTLLAGGTSMPELVTCIVAAAKKKGQLALGNIIGSNIFNILLILGISSLVRPLSTAGMAWVDIAVLMASALLVALSGYIGKHERINRLEGALMLAVEAGYLVWLIIAL